VCNHTDTTSSQPNRASRIPDFSYLFVSCTSFLSSSPSLSVLSSTQPSSENTQLSHPALSLDVMIMSWHQVQHTPRTAYTEYRIYRVQHIPSTAYTEYSIYWVQHRPEISCLPLILMIMSWPLNVASASGVPPYTIDRHQAALHDSSKVKSHSHIPRVAS